MLRILPYLEKMQRIADCAIEILLHIKNLYKWHIIPVLECGSLIIMSLYLPEHAFFSSHPENVQRHGDQSQEHA